MVVVPTWKRLGLGHCAVGEDGNILLFRAPGRPRSGCEQDQEYVELRTNLLAYALADTNFGVM